ncbi:deoxyribose-phosphate aldolase [Muriicola soli]|uniref:Deoxyribose-phosphate aldolase n=1 Tax=Muriicola soli TaxID=2507538 RepID=A0A411E6R9_9FLAO|nr:deoxyribose-phosphate aldolase [Muriicola soli]QBA63224.1 deoxyribose-phosphate aldolase [Muriicola soli]
MYLKQYIDHTLLKPTATEADVTALCKEAVHYGFYAVCVNSCYVPLAKELIRDSKVKLAAVIGFPLGAMATEAKIREVEYCVAHSADEIDMVINLGWLKSGRYNEIISEIEQIKKVIDKGTLKVILETCYLSEKEIQLACELCLKGNADMVKTSTGFGPEGATLKAIRIMKDSVGDNAGIKASGGIRDRKTALEFIKAGASRIGTSSGVKMMEE